MQIASGHVIQCVIFRFVASISLMGIEIGGAADEIICCPIDSELAVVKYGSVRGTGLAWADIELPEAVRWTEPAETDELRESVEFSCAKGRYEPAPQSTRGSEVFVFDEAELIVEGGGGDSKGLKLRLPIRAYSHDEGVDKEKGIFSIGSSSKVYTTLSWENLQGSTISMRSRYLLDHGLGGCASTLEFEIQPPPVDAGRRDHDWELRLQRTSPRS